MTNEERLPCNPVIEKHITGSVMGLFTPLMVITMNENNSSFSAIVKFMFTCSTKKKKKKKKNTHTQTQRRKNSYLVVPKDLAINSLNAPFREKSSPLLDMLSLVNDNVEGKF